MADRVATEKALVFLPAEWQRAQKREHRARLEESSLAMVLHPEGFAVVKADGARVSGATASPSEAQALVEAACCEAGA